MATRALTGRNTVYEISLLAVGTFAAFGPRIIPSVAFSAPLRLDVLALAFLGVVVLWPGPERLRGGVPWIVSGGLLGAAFIAPWAAFPWLVVPALAIAWAGKGHGRPGPSRAGSGLALLILAAVSNSALLAGASSRGVRITSEDFAPRDFRVNSLLADVPLHDVWAIDLKGHPAPTLEELGETFRGFSPFQATPAVMGLGMLREVVGFAFGWGDSRWADADASFVHRLSETDHQRSTTEPGTTFGSWRVLYACPEEGVVETLNGTVHVAVAATVGEGPEGPRLFLSFRVREVNWTTRWYMRLIDPARRFFVYPFLLRQFAHSWERGERNPPESHAMGDEI
ncbi:MAG: DUF2867 domain-containing protein [Gemmatimonadetes bacterium]|nr:DUF2867 domain-containing protein [Gemmatimonadota bacterium]